MKKPTKEQEKKIFALSKEINLKESFDIIGTKWSKISDDEQELFFHLSELFEQKRYESMKKEDVRKFILLAAKLQVVEDNA